MIQYYRASVLIIVHILILLHVYYFKDDIIGSVDFQEFFHSFIRTGVINSGVVLVIISFFVTLLFGRFFCGGVFMAVLTGQVGSTILLSSIPNKPV